MIRTSKVAVIAAFIASAGCGVSEKHYVRVLDKMSDYDYEGADEIIEKSKEKTYGERNRLLYFLDKGMALHLKGDWEGSNSYLEKAEVLIEDLYTTSISTEAASLVTNDNVIPYDGEDFERVLVNVVAALNYVDMGKLDDALVEARKVDVKLNVYNSKYESMSVYKEDAFVRYLMGIMYEARGELNDAFISYRKAGEIYDDDYLKNYSTPAPQTLPADLMRTSEALGFNDELEAFKQRFPSVSYTPQKDLGEMGEIIFIHQGGFAPRKVDFWLAVPLDDGYILKVAFPKFERNDPAVKFAELRPRGASVSARTSIAEDVSAIAVKNLQDRIGRITAKAVARATAKYLAAKGAGKAAGSSLVTMGLGIVNLVVEQADKRSWRTLPAYIGIARLDMPPGAYDLDVRFLDAGGGEVFSKTIGGVSVKKGEKTFLTYWTYR